MPHKANTAHRHHIARPKRRVTNWSDYDAALRQRGSLTVWFSQEAIDGWKAAPRMAPPGGQRHYSELAITTALTLRAVFHLALRQTEGLTGSILHLLGLDLAVPDHATIGRRADRDLAGQTTPDRGNGWSKSTAPPSGGRGRSSISASMSPPARLSPPP